MKRRLVKQAGQAITITLPIEWVRENGLEAGDEVDLAIIEKDIIIKTDHKVSKKKINLKIKNLDKWITYQYINSCYSLGIEEIEIENANNMYKIIDQSIGYAVVKQNKDEYTIKDISGSGYTNLDEIFKQVFQMLISYYDKVIEEIFGNPHPDLELIKQLDNDINKYTLFLERAIIKHAYSDNTQGKIMFAYAYSLEQIGDEIYRAMRSAIEYKIKQKKELKEIYLQSQKILLKLFELQYQFNEEKIESMLKMKDELRKNISRLKIDAHNALFLSHATRIAEESCNLIQLVLMMQLKKQIIES